MNNIFSTNALRYFENGYNVIPLLPNTKRPFQDSWQIACETRQAEYQIDSYVHSYPNHNIGIPLGEASKIIAIDFDYDADGLHEKINALIDGSPVKKKGDKGYTAFYQYNGEHPKKWYKDGKSIVELLSTGNQTVMPPSIHPDTKQPYVWVTLDTLFDMTANELPKLPSNFIEKVNEIFGYKERIIDFTRRYSSDLPELSEIEKAISFVPATEYATWLTIGMALQHNYGDAAFPAWDAWSRKASNYDARIMAYKWGSFGRSKGNPVTIATLFHYAIGCGYILPRVDIDIEIGDEFKIWSSKKPAGDAKNNNVTEEVASDFPAHLIDGVGLVAEIAAWINSTAIRRQPVLALGAAICAVGTIFAHKIRSETNLRTNFMVLGTAESGAGKEHARSCLNSLFNACNLENLILGELPSDAGVLSALTRNNGIGFAMLDEIGREIKSLNSKGAGSFEGRILTMLMKMFSVAGSMYRGKEYANHDGDMDRKDIIQPCLNIYGSTVPKRFYDAMTSDDAIDGFLARWLVFGSNDIAPPLLDGGDIDHPPYSLIENIGFIKKMPAYAAPVEGKVVMQPMPQPRVILFSDGAKRILGSLATACEENRIREIKKGSGLAAIWARTREHAIKLALVGHSYQEGIIDANVMTWACDMAMHLSHVAIKAIAENVADSDHERNVNKILKVIQKFNQHNNGEHMPHYKLTRSVQFLKPRDRNEILNQLAESGKISTKEEVSSNNKISYSYKVE